MRSLIIRPIQAGFTLVELLIVVIIIAILAAIVVPQFTSATLSGGAATFTWTGTAILQKATVLTGSINDWSDVNPQPGGNTYQVQVSSATQAFYRLKQ